LSETINASSQQGGYIQSASASSIYLPRALSCPSCLAGPHPGTFSNNVLTFSFSRVLDVPSVELLSTTIISNCILVCKSLRLDIQFKMLTSSFHAAITIETSGVLLNFLSNFLLIESKIVSGTSRI